MSSEAEVRTLVDALRKEYFDARHHCYAYRLGPEPGVTRANDDGEPAHSAGPPILGQIVAHDLTDTLVVVVRYFGGILLGVGGLVQAYKAAAKDALDQARTVTVVRQTQFRLVFDYAATGQVERILKQYAAVASDYANSDRCSVSVRVRSAGADAFRKELEAVPSVQVLAPEDVRNE